MKKYVFTNAENRIIAIQDCKLFHDENLKDLIFDFPDDFEFGTESDYKLIDGKLIFDPVIVPVADSTPTIEERVIALEEAMLETILGGVY